METYHSRPKTPVTAEIVYLSEITFNNLQDAFTCHTPKTKNQRSSLSAGIRDLWPKLLKYFIAPTTSAHSIFLYH
jgi:hypothetical protein